MKKIRALEFIVLFLFIGLLSQIASAQNVHVYNEIDVTINDDENYEPSRGYILTAGVTFNFPEYEHLTHPIRIHFIDGGTTGFVDLSETVLSGTWTYATPGEKTIEAHKWYDEISSWVLYQDFTINVVTTTAPYVSPDVVIPITTDRTWDPTANACSNPYPAGSSYLESDIGAAQAYVKYAPGHTAIVKPAIFVDGIDFSDKQIIDNAHVSDSNNGVIRYGSTGWDVVSMGSNEGGSTPGYPSEFRMYPQAFSAMSDLGYDIIFIDFERGADYLQKNSILLEEFIKSLNGTAAEPGYKEPDPVTGLTNGNVVIGASMGGLIARMALTNLEQQEIDHCTNTYVSFDAPHKGGNIGMGSQAMAWYLFNMGQHPDIDELFEEIGNDSYDKDDLTRLWEKKLNTPGARQLLVEHFGTAYQNGTIKFKRWNDANIYPLPAGVNFGCLRSSFVNELDNLGFPKNCRNVAISSGSRFAQDQGYDASDQIYELTAFADENIPLICNIDGDIVKAGVWALNGGNCDYEVFSSGNQSISLNANNVIFAAAIPDVPDLIEVLNFNWPNLCPLDPVGAYAQVVDNYPHYDNAPGSYRFDLLKYEYNQGIKEMFLGIGFSLDLNGGIIGSNERQTFIPAISSIALQGEMHNSNLWKDLSTEDLVASGKVPFDNYFLPTTNLKHVEINQEIIDWLSTELETTGGNIHDVLPYNGQTTYNFGNGARNNIPSITVQDGGVLGINNKGNTGYLNEPPSGEYVFETWTQDVCGASSDIVIEAGGRMILGNHLTTYPDDPPAPPPGDNLKGIVHLTAGSTLRVQGDGILRVARGSQLIVEEGAELILEDGARVDLWWSESTIHVKGKLTVLGKIEFVGSGFFQFEHTHTLDLVNDIFVLHGQDQDKRFIRLNKATVLDIGDGYIELKKGTVEYEANTSIRVEAGGGAHARYVTFKGYQGIYGDALVGDGASKIDVWQSDFENMATGIFATNGPEGNITRTYGCDFTNVINGVWGDNHPKLSVQNSNFYAGDLSISAVTASNVDFVTISGGSIMNFPKTASFNGAVDLREVPKAIFQSVDLFDNYLGVLLSNVPDFSVWGGDISQSAEIYANNTPPVMGIYAPQFGFAPNYSNVKLYKGATLQYNEVAIKIDQGGTYENLPYGSVTMNCAKLINNDMGIQGVDVTLEIDAYTHANCEDVEFVNPNTFINSTIVQDYEVLFDICYVQLAGDFPQILARGNYWGGGAPEAGNHYFLQNTPCDTPNEISLVLADLATGPSIYCNNKNCGDEVPGPIPGDDTKRLGNPNLEKMDFILIPNPTLDYFSVNWPDNISKAQVEIYSSLGQIVLSKTVNDTNQLVVNASDWAKGVYLVKVKNGQNSRTEMLIVN